MLAFLDGLSSMDLASEFFLFNNSGYHFCNSLPVVFFFISRNVGRFQEN